MLIGTGTGAYLVKAPDNPEGVDAADVRRDPRWAQGPIGRSLMGFLKNFYSVGAQTESWSAIGHSSQLDRGIGARQSDVLVDAWIEDFRKDIAATTADRHHGDDDHLPVGRRT